MSLDLSRPPTYLDKLPKDLVGYLVDVMHNETPKYTLEAKLVENVREQREEWSNIPVLQISPSHISLMNLKYIPHHRRSTFLLV